MNNIHDESNNKLFSNKSTHNSNINMTLRDTVKSNKKNIDYENQYIEIYNLVDEKVEKINELLLDECSENNDIIMGNTDDFFQDIALKEIEYNENYTKKELCIFAEYYDISKRKKNKSELIQDIILYENNPDNYEVVEKRKLMWYFLNELTNDRYFKKYIIYN